jgi:NAD(P)-dependent dehydrogenase (short-subunit alcohol dehydrogenase family)
LLTIDLSGRVALVLGGSRGIGEGITRLLARAGAKVVFTHTGNPAHAARPAGLQAEVQAEGGWARAEALDALDCPGTAALAARVAAEHGRLDALVCNVGRNEAQPAEGQSRDSWRSMLDLNLSTAFYGVRAALPPMLRAGYGRILLIGSSAVFDGGGGAIDYAAAKAGLVGMMSYLCRNYARRGILTNVLHPAVIATDLLNVRYGDPEARKKLIATVPAGRLGKPEDIAALTAYLLSPWGDFVCGQAILVDGGRTFFNR